MENQRRRLYALGKVRMFLLHRANYRYNKGAIEAVQVS